MFPPQKHSVYLLATWTQTRTLMKSKKPWQLSSQRRTLTFRMSDLVHQSKWRWIPMLWWPTQDFWSFLLFNWPDKNGILDGDKVVDLTSLTGIPSISWHTCSCSVLTCDCTEVEQSQCYVFGTSVCYRLLVLSSIAGTLTNMERGLIKWALCDTLKRFLYLRKHLFLKGTFLK